MNSEIELSSDILQPISLEEWPLLQELLKVDWPNNANYFYWIENSIKWKKQDPGLAIEIYCPYGSYQDDATFVAMSNYALYEVLIFTKERSGKRLYEALVQTNRIDWTQEVVFAGVDDCIQSIFASALTFLQANQGIEVKIARSYCFYIKSAEECSNVEVNRDSKAAVRRLLGVFETSKCIISVKQDFVLPGIDIGNYLHLVPEECYLGDLDPSHISQIHSLWPYARKEQPEKSKKILRAMVTLNKSIGLFLKKDNFLVSWALHNDWHGLGVVQTVEAYKRKGYAKVVVNALAKRLGNEGISPTIIIGRDNGPSENMFTSLNWRATNPCQWIRIERHLQNI